jgi:hypothetical protein
MNFFFASSLGQGPRESLILGCVSVALDVMKALLALYTAQAAASGRTVFAFVAGLVFALTSLLSLTASVGFTSTSRNAVVGTRDAQATELRDLEARIGQLSGKLRTLPNHRAKDILTVLIAGTTSDRRWRDSRECTVQRTAQHAVLCQMWIGLRAELAAAEEAARIEGDLVQSRARITELRRHGAAFEVDPQAKLVAAATGLSETTARRILLTFLAFVIELTSGLALYLALGPAPRTVINSAGAIVQQPQPRSADSEPRIALAVPSDIKLGDRRRRG